MEVFKCEPVCKLYTEEQKIVYHIVYECVILERRRLALLGDLLRRMQCQGNNNRTCRVPAPEQ